MPFSFKPQQEGEIPAEASVANNTAAPLSTSTPVSAVSNPPATLSFITRFNGGEKPSFIQMVLLVVFGLCIVTTIALFGYSYYLNQQINNKKSKLVEYDKQLKSFPIQDVSALSGRLKIIKQLISEHSSVNTAFAVIEKSVEDPITYKHFDLHFSGGSRTYELQLAAVAPDYHSVVEQINTLKKLEPYKSYISNVVISNLHPDDTGKVTFDLTMPISISGANAMPEDFLVKVKNAEGQPETPANNNAPVGNATSSVGVESSTQTKTSPVVQTGQPGTSSGELPPPSAPKR